MLDECGSRSTGMQSASACETVLHLVGDRPIVRLRYDAAMAGSTPPEIACTTDHRPSPHGCRPDEHVTEPSSIPDRSDRRGRRDRRGAARCADDGSGSTAVSAPGQKRGFHGVKPGEEREVDGTRLCWCPPGRFVMGSPSAERGRRQDEAQVEVTLSRGFWTGKWEVTQGQWKRLMGKFPDRLPSPEFGEGEEFPGLLDQLR